MVKPPVDIIIGDSLLLDYLEANIQALVFLTLSRCLFAPCRERSLDSAERGALRSTGYPLRVLFKFFVYSFV